MGWGVTNWQFVAKRGRVRYTAKLDRPRGPVCLDSMRVTEGPAMVLRPVGEVTARSEPSIQRLLDNDKTGQLSRARDRLSTFCKKLRRTISEFVLTVRIKVHAVHLTIHP